MANQIKITRTGTPRFGSRNWAHTLKGEWTAKRASWEFGCLHGYEVFVGERCLAVVTDDLLGLRPSLEDQCLTLNYGGENIGNALFGDICEALGQMVDTDDDTPVAFVKA